MQGLEEHSHPMYSTDRPIVDRFMAKPISELSNEDVTDAARLLLRYDNFPGCKDIRGDILLALDKWGKTPEQLHVKAREIWQSGWRPGHLSQDEVGSGADVNCGK